MRRTIILGAVCAAAVIFLLLPSAGGASGTGGGVLKVATNNFPDSMNPFVGLDGEAYTVWAYVYPKIVTYDEPSLKIVGSYATSWTRSANGLTWTFRLHPGWKWSDGQPVTARDAAWTYNTIIKFQKGPTGTLAGEMDGIGSATASNATTLVLHMAKPITPSLLLSNLLQVPILPQHVWAQYATGNGSRLKTFTNSPSSGHPFVAGGAFTVISYSPDNTVVMGRNPDWTGPKPLIDGWGEQNFTDSGGEIQALKSGAVDFAWYGVDPNTVTPLRAAGVKVNVTKSTEEIDLAINAQHDRAHPELGNLLVREAFDYAIDRRAIAQTAWSGYAQPIEDGIVVSGQGDAPGTKLPWADPAIKPPAFNLAKANQLLNKAGYKMGSNGVRVADGHPMSYSVILETAIGGPGYRMFSIMQRDFAKIGVRLNVKPLDFAAALSAAMANHYSNYDMLYDSNGGPIDPGYMLSSSTCAQLESQNDPGYCNKKFDRLFAQQSVAASTEKRVAIVWKMEKLFSSFHSYIGIVSQGRFNAWNKHWTGYVSGPEGNVYWPSIQTLFSVHQTH